MLCADREKFMENLIERIIDFEWNEFQHVKNEGGRASCQDDRRTFEIARKSQFMSWNARMLNSYMHDLTVAKGHGRNLVAEKYARMMESTSPEQFEKLKHRLPELSDKMKNMIEEIMKIRINWAEEFAEDYPYISGNGRLIHSREDSIFDTSIETYLRGELGTYSENTIMLYLDYVKQLESEGRNQSKIIMQNTALLYGNNSLEEAEESLKKRYNI